jgi:hypothetical protein
MYLQPREVATRLAISYEQVLALVRAGELVGINTAAKLTGRPHYSIALESVEEFERRRRVGPAPQSKRRAKADTGVIKFY